MNLLDRPVWASLSTAHAGLSLGDEFARRYDPKINRFASARDESGLAQQALARLVQPREHVFVLQVPEIQVPSGLVAVKQAQGVQMVAREPVATSGDGADSIMALSDHDAPEMLALATLTEPGPFLRNTHRMGRFVGIRIDGRLVAMAGERFRFPGYTEVSGVCTHPQFRGQGLARRLSRHVAAGIAARGETAFLHEWKSNVAAIALYHALGFRWRCDVNVAVLERDTGAADPH